MSATFIEPHFVDVGELPVRVRAAGNLGCPGVLLLHGARFTSADWEELGTLRVLAEAGFRAVAVDLPGYGETSAQESLEPGVFLGEVIQALGLVRPVVVSPSMSGRFSLPLVSEHPERLAGFVPVGVAGGGSHLAALSSVELPTLVVWGGEDGVFPVSDGRALATAMPNAELFVIEGASHPCYLDEPASFHARLLEFLGPQSSRK